MAVTAGLILFMGWGYSQAHRAERAYTDNNLLRLRDDEAIPANTGASLTPANTIRLHIPANSDEASDQRVKEEVRDAVIERFGAQLAGAVDADEAEERLRRHLPEIEALANECLKLEGVSYGARAYLKTVYFPEKTYELSTGQSVHLPEGNYKALQVVLGSGKGTNWWCVMYPPLCYFDLVQRGVVPGVPVSGRWTDPEGAGPIQTGNGEGVIFIDESMTEDVKIEVRSLLLDAIRTGIVRIGKALSVLAQAAPGKAVVGNTE